MNRSLFLCLAACRMRSSACDTLSRLVSGPCFAGAAHSLGLRPWSPGTGSAADRSGPVRRLPSYYGGVLDPHRLRIIGYGSSPSRCGLSRQHAYSVVGREVFPVPAHGACGMARFFDHAGSTRACAGALDILPSHYTDSVGTRNQFIYRGSMAGLHVLPTLRRNPHGCLRTASADVVRYSFIVVDLHHLLSAGLPAHP